MNLRVKVSAYQQRQSGNMLPEERVEVKDINIAEVTMLRL